MFAKQNALSANSLPAPCIEESGISPTPTTRPTLSILSPSASDREAHAKFLRDKYGIPVLMDPELAEETFGPMENYV